MSLYPRWNHKLLFFWHIRVKLILIQIWFYLWEPVTLPTEQRKSHATFINVCLCLSLPQSNHVWQWNGSALVLITTIQCQLWCVNTVIVFLIRGWSFNLISDYCMWENTCTWMWIVYKDVEMGPFVFCYISSAALRYISSAPPHLSLTANR